MLARLDKFEPRHVGAMQAYLRMSVINRIRDEIRRVGRRPEAVELTDDAPSDATSPLEAAIREEAYQRYRGALKGLRTRDREMVVARIEVQWSIAGDRAALRHAVDRRRACGREPIAEATTPHNSQRQRPSSTPTRVYLGAGIWRPAPWYFELTCR